MPSKRFQEPKSSMMYIYTITTQYDEKHRTHRELLSVEVTCEERDVHTYTHRLIKSSFFPFIIGGETEDDCTFTRAHRGRNWMSRCQESSRTIFLFFETGSLNQNQKLPLGLAWVVSLFWSIPQPSLCLPRLELKEPFLSSTCVGFRHPSSGHFACRTSILSTEPSPQPKIILQNKQTKPSRTFHMYVHTDGQSGLNIQNEHGNMLHQKKINVL